MHIYKHYSHLNASRYHFPECQENIPKMKPQKLGEHNPCDLSPDTNDELKYAWQKYCIRDKTFCEEWKHVPSANYFPLFLEEN